MTGSAPIEVDESAFDLQPPGAIVTGAAALCLHGLTGTPYEVRPVAEALVARGVRACGIWLPGHGGSVDELAAATRVDWVERARDVFRKLHAEHDRVYMVGVSMGGLISLRLAQDEDVRALVVIGTPLALAPPVPQLTPWLRYVWKARPKRGSDIRDPDARARHPRFPAMPLASVSQMIALQKEVIRDLSRVRAPILIAHGRLDRTARPRDAHRLHANVGSVEKRLLWLPRSGHIATVDYDAPVLLRAATDFLVGY